MENSFEDKFKIKEEEKTTKSYAGLIGKISNFISKSPLYVVYNILVYTFAVLIVTSRMHINLLNMNTVKFKPLNEVIFGTVLLISCLIHIEYMKYFPFLGFKNSEDNKVKEGILFLSATSIILNNFIFYLILNKWITLN